MTTLVTNEVKDSGAVEREFLRISTEGRTFEYALKTEPPNLRQRIFGSHRETGAGSKLRRSSMIQVSVETTGVNGEVAVTKARIVLDTPVGNVSSSTPAKDALAMLGSLTFTLASSTFLHDGTGNGAAVLLSGGVE